jgi:aminomethyltransferase
VCAGNDLNETTTPIEASLKWTIGKRRQEKFDFIGGEAVKNQIANGISKRRVGVLSVGAPARAGAPITLPDGTEVRESLQYLLLCQILASCLR